VGPPPPVGVVGGGAARAYASASASSLCRPAWMCSSAYCYAFAALPLEIAS
jgi:hypothetical protein